MLFGDELTDAVLRAVYGLAKGQAGVGVKMSSLEMQTGLDEGDIRRSADAMMRKGFLVPPQEAGHLVLSKSGVAAAKGELEGSTDFTFAESRAL